MQREIKMYDYSLNEKYDNIKHHIELYCLNYREECEKLAEVLDLCSINKTHDLLDRKDYHNVATGEIIVQLEWITFDIKKLSPYEITKE